MRALILAAVLAAATTGSSPAQFSVLSSPEGDTEQAPAAVPVAAPVCGTQPLTIARLGWASASLLAEIHALILSKSYGCQVQIVPGDLAASASTMGASGTPAVVPEMWVSRVPDVWNGAIETQLVRSAAPSYDKEQFEAWYMPTQTAALFTQGPSIANLGEAIPLLSPSGKIQFISCPADWACAVINRNLIAALGLADRFEVIEPANRFEMDRLIAEAVNKREAFVFYYWQPNAVLAQLDFTPVDMGPYQADAAKCLASNNCPSPVPSSFAPETVVIALAERVVTETPVVAGYFQRATLPLVEMDKMLAELNENGATEASVAERFVATREAIWSVWAGQGSESSSAL